jgi:hypothetical protein
MHFIYTYTGPLNFASSVMNMGCRWLRAFKTIVSSGINPSYIRHPQIKKIMYKNIWCTAVVWKSCKFPAVQQVGLMTHGKCRIDRLFLYHVIRSWVRTSPPPAVWALSLFKPTFLRYTLSTPKCCHNDMWSARLVLTHHYRHQLHPSLLHQHPESRVSIFLFYPWCFSLAGCLFPFFSQANSCCSALPFWVNMSWE